MKHYIGLDIGTTTISVSIAVAPTLKQVGAFNILNESTIRTSIQNPQVILDSCNKLLEKCFALYDDIEGIGITGQMHGVILIDKDGNAVSPLYTWQSELGAPFTEEIKNKTSYRVPSGYGFSTVYALKKTGSIPQNAVTFCSIMDYIAMHITNNCKPIIHASVAASFGLYNLDKNCFDLSATEKLGFDESFVPESVFDEIKIGDYKGASVYIPIGDNQASNLGVTAGQEKTLCINCGTGSQVSVAVKDWHGHKCQEVRPFVNKTYLLTGSALCGGRAFALLNKFFSSFAKTAGYEVKDMYAVLDKLVESDNLTLDVDTRFCGTREDPLVTGSIKNITEQNFTPSAMAKGFLIGMAKELYDMFAEMGVSEIKRIIGSGNGIKKNLAFSKILTEMFKMKVENSVVSEEAAYGASLIATNLNKIGD